MVRISTWLIPQETLDDLCITPKFSGFNQQICRIP